MWEVGSVTRFAVKDELLDAQVLRTAGAALYGGADIGECLATARQVKFTSTGVVYGVAGPSVTGLP
jgi:hypothetical protein